MDNDGLYDFKDLRSFNADYSAQSDFTDPNRKEVNFNFCKLIQGCGSGNTFASVRENDQCYELTDGDQKNHVAESVTAEDGSEGIRISRQGTTKCVHDEDRMFGFVVDIFCDENITANAPSKIVGSDSYEDLGDPCMVHVQMKHAAGCAQVNFTWGRRAVGTAMIAIGVLLTMMNIKYIKWFMATIV